MSAPSNAPTEPFTSQPTDIDAWKKMFTSCRNESAEVISAPGLPSDLVGTFYRNGGGKYDIGKEKVLHPFDGDGYVITSHSFILFSNAVAAFIL